MLADLLMGRAFRIHAAEALYVALEYEKLGMPDDVQAAVDRAAHWEWMAVKSEQGLIAWGGGRLNRCGRAEGGDGNRL